MGARRLIEAAIQAELAEFLQQFETRKTSEGKRGVIRNGYQPEREILTGIGAVSVRMPKVRSRTGEPVTFRSALLPPYVRKTKSLEAALPWLYLKGISTGEMQEALSVLVGPDAKGLSPGVIRRLKESWVQEYSEWTKRRLDKDRWVYLWADGIYSGIRASYGPSVCSRDCRSERSGRKALPGDRRWNEGVDPELEGCPPGSEGTRPFIIQTRGRGWSHGILGRVGGSLSPNEASAVLGS